MHRFSKVFAAIFFFLVFGAGLILINRDIFLFENDFNIQKTFTPQNDTKGIYQLTRALPLSKGNYQINFSGHTDGTGNGYLIQCAEVTVLQNEFSSGLIDEEVNLQILEPSCQMKVSVIYHPGSNDLEIDRIKVFSDHVVFRDSILRHVIQSIAFVILFILTGMRFILPQKWFRIFGRLASPVNERIFLFLIAITVITSYPMFRSDSYIVSNDLPYHLARIEGITESLKAGIFPARIHLFLLSDYGYGNGLYYPDIFLYFPALLRLFGFEIITTAKIFIVLTQFFSISSMYIATTRIAKSRYAGIIAALLYGFASYRLTAIYNRAAFGEMQAMIFLPWVALGFYEIYNDNPQGWRTLSVGFIGVALSHLISLFLTGLVTLIAMLLLWRKTFSRPVLSALLKTGLVVMGVTAFFFLPMGEQLLSANTVADTLLTAPETIAETYYVLPLQALISWRANWNDYELNLGWPLLLLPLLFVIPGVGDNRQCKLGIALVSAGFLIALASTNLFPWQVFKGMLGRIQSSFRLLVIATPLMALGGGLLIDSITHGSGRLAGLLAVFGVCLLSGMPLLDDAATNRTIIDPAYYLEDRHVSKGEYLPVGADIDFIDRNRDTVLSENTSFETIGFKRAGLSFTFSYRVTTPPPNDEPLHFEVPLLFYKGYQAWIETPDGGSKAWLSVQRGPHGFSEVSITDYPEQGEITVEYFTTNAQYAGSGITALTLLSLFISWIRARKKSADRRMLR